eukprot:2123839-Rhodomonas_salina.2
MFREINTARESDTGHQRDRDLVRDVGKIEERCEADSAEIKDRLVQTRQKHRTDCRRERTDAHTCTHTCTHTHTRAHTHAHVTRTTRQSHTSLALNTHAHSCTQTASVQQHMGQCTFESSKHPRSGVDTGV